MSGSEFILATRFFQFVSRSVALDNPISKTEAYEIEIFDLIKYFVNVILLSFIFLGDIIINHDYTSWPFIYHN